MVGLNDVRVDEVRDELCFANEVLDENLLICERLANYFDGNAFGKAASTLLFSFVDDAHAALAQFAKDFVMEIALDGEQPGHSA
jgi:hypothetical protein